MMMMMMGAFGVWTLMKPYMNPTQKLLLSFLLMVMMMMNPLIAMPKQAKQLVVALSY